MWPMARRASWTARAANSIPTQARPPYRQPETCHSLPKEDNASLGVRGIRLCMVRPDLFIPQLRAIYRAATYGRILIMFPMIATLEDGERARATPEQVRQELTAPPVPLGIMIE